MSRMFGENFKIDDFKVNIFKLQIEVKHMYKNSLSREIITHLMC